MHPATPGCGRVIRDPFQNSEGDVLLQILADFLVHPVRWDRGGLVDSYWLGSWLEEESEGRQTGHEGEWLVWASVKRLTRIVLQYPVPNLLSVCAGYWEGWLAG